MEAIDAGDGHGLNFEDGLYDSLPVRRLSFNLAATPDPFRWAYDNPWIGEHLRGYLTELVPDVLHLISGYLMSGSTLRVASDLGIGTVITLTDFWFLCPRITLLRRDGQLCAPPFDAATCARCLGEQRRRYRIPGRIAPALMDAFWRMRKGWIAQIEARTAFMRETLNHVDAVISPSRFLGALFVEAGVAPGRIIFSRQGRDFPNLKPEVLQKTAAAHLRIGHLGQIAPHKGVHTLFEAVRQLPGAPLEVRAYGDGSRFPGYTRRLRHMARQDSRLSLVGVYDRTDVSRILQGLDVVVVPSVWYENSPNTILEAFSHRTPVVASDLGGMAELVEEGVNGLRFTPGDASSLAAKLRQLIDQPGLLAQLRAGIGPVKSVAEEMAELLEVYRAVAEERNARGLGRSSRSVLQEG
ncbi:MAG: glycosyltransferase [Anaerolineae bacterium]|nr:glycosyltransferase [Anaerolineae bacterium]